MSGFTNERIYMSIDQPAGIVDNSRRKQQSQHPRQLLSCTKCRERKVKCDRTKPCSACCARGTPKDCHFIAEGGDYTPIQQSYELRKLRAENLRLKERLRASKISIEDEDDDPAVSPEPRLGVRPTSSQKRRAAKQKRFQGSEWQDSLYFGSPGLASVVTDFAELNINSESASLAYLMPRGPEMYTPRDNPPAFPFPTLFPAIPDKCIPELLRCLPSREELLEYLNSFERRVNVFSFPHIPIEISRSEVERFLSDAKKNAQTYPDMLALLFAAIALGAQHSVWDRSGEQWNAEVMNTETGKGDVYIAAAMQALRLGSFMHKPSLLGIQALIMIGPYLTNSGRFLDGWTLFGTTIRLAHSIGLHRHPKYLDPAPPTQRECSIRQTLWWWMLHMDEQYSMTLGRPLGISGIGDCPWPHELTTNPAMLRFGEFVNHFTVLARGILSSDRLTLSKIDEYTDTLRGLLDTMPETLQFDDTWSQPETEIPEWPLSAMAAVYYCKTHTYLVLLNRQRNDQHTRHSETPNTQPSALSFRAVNRTPSSYPSTPTSAKACLRGRPLVLSSSESILGAFLFLHRRLPAALIDWTIGQQAFNSCMILLLDAIEVRRITEGAMQADLAFIVFRELEANHVHKLAGLAIERISWGLQELRRVVEVATEESRTRVQQGGHADMQGADRSEATQGSRPVDTVMGNTGLALLEDPGLQAFVEEDWALFAWANPKEQEPQSQRESRQRGGLRSETAGDNVHVHGFRSTDTIQGTRRSTTRRSAPTRYATPSADDSKPHGCTAPTSPTSHAIPKHNTLQAAGRVHRERQMAQGYHRLNPPHFPQTKSYEAASEEYGGFSSASTKTQGSDSSSLTPPVDSRQVPSIQLRHNSYPSLPQSACNAPLLRTSFSSSSSNVDRPTTTRFRGTPHRASIPASMGASGSVFRAYLEAHSESNPHAGDASVRSPFAARPTAPISSMADTSTSFSPTSADHAPMMSSAPSRVPEQQQQGYSFPTDVPNVPMTSFAENVSLEEWQRRMGSSGA